MLLHLQENPMSFNQDNNSEKCKSTALRYVAMQIKTEGQIEDYLKRKSFAPENIKEAIEYLRDYNYVNDSQYCVSYYREACLKGKGRRRIEQELLNKKVRKDVIKDALDNFISEDNPDYVEIIEEAGNEKERALAVGRKMLRQHLELGKEADKNFMAKVGRRLISLGYDNHVLYSVIGILMKEGRVQDEEY